MTNLSIFRDPNGVRTVRPGTLSSLAQSLNVGLNNIKKIEVNTNGTFRRVANGEHVGKPARGEIDVIIANMLPSVSRVFYKADYDPNAQAQLPDCWSDLGHKPEEAAKNKQAENCASCPQNVVGSGKQGGRACRFRRNIAVLLVGDVSGDVYRIGIPAKSLFGKGTGHTHPFESYIKHLIAHGESPDDVVTNISYNDDAASMELVFTPVRHITTEEASLLRVAQASEEAKNYPLVAIGNISNSPVIEGAVTTKTAAPAPVKAGFFDDGDDEASVTATPEPEVAQPAKRRGRPAAVVPTITPDVAAIVAEWGDE